MRQIELRDPKPETEIFVQIQIQTHVEATLSDLFGTYL
jgi:hypothetical protein